MRPHDTSFSCVITLSIHLFPVIHVPAVSKHRSTLTAGASKLDRVEDGSVCRLELPQVFFNFFVATNTSFAVTKVCLSRRTYFCRNKHNFVATKVLSGQAYYCHDKYLFVATKIFCRDKHGLSQQNFCRDKNHTCGS